MTLSKQMLVNWYNLAFKYFHTIVMITTSYDLKFNDIYEQTISKWKLYDRINSDAIYLFFD